jgi:hypothetical protein
MRRPPLCPSLPLTVLPLLLPHLVLPKMPPILLFCGAFLVGGVCGAEAPTPADGGVDTVQPTPTDLRRCADAPDVLTFL